MYKLIKESFTHFLDSDPFQEGAALAYYSIFSLIPIVIIAISFLDLFFSNQAVSGEIFIFFKDTLGHDAAFQLQNIIKEQHINHNSFLTSLVGFVSLAVSASGMLAQIHDSFNRIWSFSDNVKSNIFMFLLKHMRSFFLLLLFLFFIFLSTYINSFLVKHYNNLHIDYKFLVFLEHFISFILASVIFTLMFKTLGDVKVNLKPSILGALITSILFFIGKLLVGKYFGLSDTSSTFGSSSFLALLMLWVYYISQIIFLGASFVKIISDRLGCKIVEK